MAPMYRKINRPLLAGGYLWEWFPKAGIRQIAVFPMAAYWYLVRIGAPGHNQPLL